MFKSKLLIILFLLSFISCADNTLLIKELHTPNYIKLPLTVESVNVFDERKNIVVRKLDIPTISFQGEKDEIEPVLSENHEAFIKEEAVKYFANSGTDVKVNVIIKEAIQRFSTSFTQEVEYVNVSLMINIYDGVHKPFLYSSSGEVFYQINTLDASHEDFEQLYLKAFEACINKLFEKINELTLQK